MTTLDNLKQATTNVHNTKHDQDQATQNTNTTKQAHTTARNTWTQAIYNAIDAGEKKTHIAAAAGISRARLYQIIKTRSAQ